MAALEYRVISEILRTKRMQEAIVSGLKKDHFRDLEARGIYEFIWNHYYARDTAKQVPLVESIKKRWGSFEMTAGSKEDQGALKSLIKELKFAALSTDMESLAREFSELVSDNPEDALKIMRNQLASITHNFESKGGFGIREIAEGVREQYEGAQLGTVFGLPWPWECLTQDTLGKNKGDLIVFYGRMKSMKTWVVLKCAVHDFVENKQRVLFWSREMGPTKLKLRLGAILANVDYQCLKKGDLPKRLYERTLKVLEELDQMMVRSKKQLENDAKLKTSDLVVLAGRDAPKTLIELRTAIDIYQPDVVYLDSFYHMESDRVKGNMQHWTKIMLLAEDLKDAALDFEIPFVLAGQANREGEKMTGENMTDVAGADALAREADLVIRVVRKRGNELWEADYEQYWESQGKHAEQAMARMARRAAARIVIPVKGRPASVVPAKALPINGGTPKSMRRPRTCAELALMPSGNREGTLEGFIIRATPGYDWPVIKDNVTPDEVKEWLGEGRKSSGKRRKKSDKDPESYADAVGPALKEKAENA
jgi:hypothetical protein